MAHPAHTTHKPLSTVATSLSTVTATILIPTKQSPVNQATSSFIDGAIGLLYATISAVVAFVLYKIVERVIVRYAKKRGNDSPLPGVAPTLDLVAAIAEYTSRLRKKGVVTSRVNPILATISKYDPVVTQFIEGAEAWEQNTTSWTEAGECMRIMNQCKKELEEIEPQQQERTAKALHELIDNIEKRFKDAEEKLKAAMKQENTDFLNPATIEPNPVIVKPNPVTVKPAEAGPSRS